MRGHFEFAAVHQFLSLGHDLLRRLQRKALLADIARQHIAQLAAPQERRGPLGILRSSASACSERSLESHKYAIRLVSVTIMAGRFV